MEQLYLPIMKKSQVPAGLKLTEHELMNWCISYLSLRGHYVQRINSGKLPVFQNGRIARMVKLAETGTPDIIGYSRSGIFIGIEVKVKPNKPMPAQLEFIGNAKRCGCIAEIIYSQEQLMEVKGL